MKQSALKLIGVLGVLGLALQGAPAFSSRAPVLVSGSVTSINGGQIVVNGVSYDVQLQGQALHQLEQVRVGDKVDLVLSGRPGSGATQVSAIRVHHAP
ncbi:MAG TPA: hypothetical protein VMD56_13615 [Steroidobacteraceae bacterium]|nr:hypothetical protein [Steroidobacteraceae bacterium]